MHWGSVVLPGLMLACAPQPTDGAESTSSDATTGSASSTTAGATTTEAADSSSGLAPEPPPEPIDVMQFSRCDGTGRDPLCIATDETCICGPGCLEYGPAGAPGRCPLGDFVALCPGDADVPYVCVIPCTDDTDCPDPAMVCRPCTPELEHACLDLGNFHEASGLNSGPGMCTWPKT